MLPLTVKDGLSFGCQREKLRSTYPYNFPIPPLTGSESSAFEGNGAAGIYGSSVSRLQEMCDKYR